MTSAFWNPEGFDNSHAVEAGDRWLNERNGSHVRNVSYDFSQWNWHYSHSSYSSHRSYSSCRVRALCQKTLLWAIFFTTPPARHFLSTRRSRYELSFDSLAATRLIRPVARHCRPRLRSARDEDHRLIRLQDIYDLGSRRKFRRRPEAGHARC